jgi:4-amino-4-deoxy-L-arabinose transferase-like glycosyltransferase
MSKSNIDKKVDHGSVSEVLPLVCITLVSILILPISGVDVHNNTAIYLRLADKMMEGDDTGMVFPAFESSRGPLFPMLLVSGFKLMGKTVHSASLITRLFFSLGIVLTYLLARILYGRATGILASVLVITSGGINYIAEFIDTDIVLPVFILSFVLLYYLSLNRSRRCFAILAGLSLGLALMVKESALLCIGIPLGMSLLAPKGKHIDYIKSSLWVIGSATITLAPWMIVTLKTHGSLLPMLGVAHPDVFQHLVGRSTGFGSSLSYWMHLLTLGLKDALGLFYLQFLCKTTGLAPLMVAGWIILLIRGLFYKKQNDLILAISVASFLPLILYMADTHDRLGQTTVVYMILYISVANLVVVGVPFLTYQASKIINKFSKNIIFQQIPTDAAKSKNSSTAIILVSTILITTQLFSKPGRTWRNWTRGQNSLAVFSWKSFNAHGRFTNDQQEAAEWLKENKTAEARILADGYTTEPLEFFDAVDYKIPLFRPKEGMSIVFDTAQRRTDNARPLYLFTYSGFKSGAQRHRIIYPIFEEDIVEAIREEYPDYLVISWRSLFYGEYFDKAKWAELKFANESVRIYEIDLDSFEPVVFEKIGVNDTFDEHLIWLKEHYFDEYTLLEEKIRILGLTVDELRNSQLTFPTGRIY